VSRFSSRQNPRLTLLWQTERDWRTQPQMDDQLAAARILQVRIWSIRRQDRTIEGHAGIARGRRTIHPPEELRWHIEVDWRAKLPGHNPLGGYSRPARRFMAIYLGRADF
jgi:hypothetical protein